MGLNIVLEASHNFNNKYGNDIWKLSNKVCNIIEKVLIEYNCDIYRLDDINGNVDKSLYEKSKYLDEFNPDIYLLINFNSDDKISDKKGLSIHANRKSSEDNIILAKTMLKNINDNMKSNLSYLNNYNVLDTMYTLCKDKEYISIIINGPYITNLFEIEYIKSGGGLDTYASSVYNSIISYYNLSKLDCNNILNIDEINNKELLMNNYIIKDLNGVSVAVEKSNLSLSILEKSNKSLNKFVVRRRFNELDSEKIKTDDVAEAVNLCDTLFGYSVYSTDGTLIHKSNKGYTNIGNISKSLKRERYAIVSKLGGVIIKTNIGNKTLQLGTKVKVLDIKNTICSVEVLYDNTEVYGDIDSKYLNF